MSRTAPPRHATRADAALPADLQRVFDRRAALSIAGLARALGVSTHQVDSLMYGGRSSVALVARCVAGLRALGET